MRPFEKPFYNDVGLNDTAQYKEAANSPISTSTRLNSHEKHSHRKQTSTLNTKQLPTLNAMTVDIEDYFQVTAFENYIPRESWNSLECRVERNVDQILESFSSSNIKATFFTLGWIAERYPEMIRRIVLEGHELASHGWDHVQVSNQNPEEFTLDITNSKKVLEEISGRAVLGYRAPCYSINRSNLWAHDILRNAGYQYSSSIAPISYANYGISDAPRFAHYRRGEHRVAGPADDAILEIPITTISVPKRNLPCGGGGWFRLYPYRCSKWAMQWVNHHDKQACVFYFHPWEIDLDQPRQTNLDWKTKFRHYQNLRHMSAKLDRLQSDFRWGRMIDVFDIRGSEAYNTTESNNTKQHSDSITA